GGWSRTDLTPVTQPAAVGNHLLLYVASKGTLRIAALDPRTGKTIWSRAATTSYITNGDLPFLTVIGKRVFYLRAAGSLARLVAADVATGRDIWATNPGAFSSWPGICPERPTAVCVTGWVAGLPQRMFILRFDSGSLGLLQSPPISKSFGGRLVADGLFEP